jgi:diadenosine tetraphosphate (Ap4A) HIT family hydrolase
MSVFLEIDPHEWVASNALAFAIRDRYPVGDGHTFLVPRRLVSTWWEATLVTDLLNEAVNAARRHGCTTVSEDP